ncbi:MAG: tetratricopeptide (TPR) repeat protein [Sphingobacteriales bacterium]|jgi:tetratricopeptide (TPR) repeat protein
MGNLKNVWVLLVLFTLLTSCDSTKDTFINRNYHNITAEFNGLFNARNRLNEGINKLESKNEDNYKLVLPILILGDDKSARTIYPLMDEAIKKASYVIQRHKISKYISDSYLVIGKAYFYKRDYYSAIQSFQLIYNKYPDTKQQLEASIWLLRSYIQIDRKVKIESIYNIVRSKEDYPKKMREDLATTFAIYFMRKGNYGRASEELKLAARHTRKKDHKTRYLFIAAQLLEIQGKNNQAIDAYQNVVRKNPPYEMAFNAKIKQASLIQGANKRSEKEVVKQLNDLLNDDKNIEYRDQIYFALGNIEYANNRFETASNFYKESVANSTSNSEQKAQAYNKLADISYSVNKNYQNAFNYYDSALNAYPKTYEKIDELRQKRNSLELVVINENIVSREDSLQRIAQMDPKSREKFLENLIQEARDKKEREKDDLRNQPSTPSVNNNNQSINQTPTSAQSWYFSNPAAIGSGFSEFKAKWGNRTLEDNWRRSTKSQNNLAQNTGKVLNLNDPDAARKELLEGLPMNKEKMDRSDSMIKNALFELGNVYRFELADIDKAIESFEDLASRKSKNPFLIDAYFNLYQLYSQIGNSDLANKYKNQLLAEYPESVYANLIRDPNYYTKAGANKTERLYESAYNDYKNGFYRSVVTQYNQAYGEDPTNQHIPKFLFLKALAAGGNGDEGQMQKDLSLLINTFPDSEIRPNAEELLAKLKNKNTPRVPTNPIVNIPEVKNPWDSFYAESKGKPFYFMLLLKSDEADVSALKTVFSDFNRTYFKLGKLKVSNRLINDSTQVILVKQFDDKNKSIDYLETLTEEIIKKAYPDKLLYDKLIISSDNYISLIKSRDLALYELYYNSELKKQMPQNGPK